jgi:hypothetical protein
MSGLTTINDARVSGRSLDVALRAGSDGMHQLHAFLLNVDGKMVNLYYLLGRKSIVSCATGVQIRS